MRQDWLSKFAQLRRQWIPYLVLTGALAVTALATAYVEKTSHERDRIRFQNVVQRTQETIESRIETYIALLRGGAGLFSADQTSDQRVGREQFRAYTKRLLLRDRYPGVQGIGFSKKIRPPEKEDLIESLQTEGLNNFGIRPDFARAEYHATIYLEPLDRRNQAAIGYDMFTEPTRRTAMERARDLGVPAASGKVTLVQEIDEQKQAGFLIYMPVYRTGNIPNTVAERRAELEGFIYSPFRADDLMLGIFGVESYPFVDFHIYDGLSLTHESLLHQSRSTGLNYQPRFTTTQIIDIAGRPWTIFFTSRPAFDATSSIGLVPYVALGGTFISFVLFGVTRSQVRARTEAELSAAQLRQSQQDLQNAHDQLETRVEKRTAELATANAILQEQITQRQLAEQSLQQAFTFEALLKRITDRVRDSLDEHQILQTAVQELAVGLQVGCCDTGLYDLDNSTSTVCAEHTTTMPSHLGATVQMSDFPEGYRQLMAGQYFQFCPIGLNPMRGQSAILACPIFDDQGALGDLWLFHQLDQAFDEFEVRLVEQVANQCAIALRQARLYETAQAQVKALEKLNWLKDEFLSTVSHELRTPVSNMKMAIRMLEITLDRSETTNGRRQKTPQYLQILNSECQREIDLINDLLDLQRLEAGKRAIALETVQLQLWLPQLVEPFQDRAQARQQTLKLDLPPQELPPLVADIASLERVLSELLNNACKYTPPGETIVVHARVHLGRVQLSVCNSGVEIPEQELPRIFDKFYRVPSADPWKQGGTGLGLALVQRLVEHLGGTIHVESGDGITTFTVVVLNQALPANVYR